MHEAILIRLLTSLRRPASIGEVRDILARQLGKRVSYETVKRDLMALAARGEIQSKSIGSGRRVSWIFWAGETLTEPVALQETDPFQIPVTDRDAMDPKELSRLYDRLLAKYQTMIKEALRSRARFLVLCDRKIVYSSESEIPDEAVSSLEREYGKTCYVVTEDMIEEAAWSRVDDDYYPAVSIFLGSASWTDDMVFEHGLRVLADFDTGNPDVAAFDQEDLIELKLEPPRFLRRAIHLGRYYDYYSVPLKIGIRDMNARRRCMVKACRSVMWWRQPEMNPFLLANPGRQGFVGRDLLLEFPCSILLAGKEKSSKTYLT